MTAGVLTLGDAAARAAAASEAAQTARAALAAGQDVDARELADLELAEQHARRQHDAAAQRDEQRREREAAEELEARRAALQLEWAEVAGEPDHLVEARTAAAEACAAYLRQVVAHLDRRDDVRERAREAGLRVPDRGDFRRSPLPALAKAILAAAGSDIDWSWKRPASPGIRSIWEGFGA